MYYYLNNKFIKSDKAQVSFSDGGFLYGDGLFETMRFDKRNIFSINDHLDRLFQGLEIIHLKNDYGKNDLKKLLYQVIEKNDLEYGIIRLMITRGNTDQQLGPINNSSLFISIKPFYEIPSSPVKVIYLDETRFPIIRFSPAIKSMNYLGNMLAKKESTKRGAFEPVFYNPQKNHVITECAIRNIFYIKNNILLTPPTSLGILPGVMRDQIITIANEIGIQVEKKEICLYDVKNMDEAFISSTGIGMLECFWDDWTSDYLHTKRIKKELFKRINNS